MSFPTDEQLYSTSNVQWPNPYAPNQGLYSSVMMTNPTDSNKDQETTFSGVPPQPQPPPSHFPMSTFVVQEPVRTYVNPKQYYRILKRREVRSLIEEKRAKSGIRPGGDISRPQNRKKHQSRTNHASKRPRIHGRFLSGDGVNVGAMEEKDGEHTCTENETSSSPVPLPSSQRQDNTSEES